MIAEISAHVLSVLLGPIVAGILSVPLSLLIHPIFGFLNIPFVWLATKMGLSEVHIRAIIQRPFNFGMSLIFFTTGFLYCALARLIFSLFDLVPGLIMTILLASYNIIQCLQRRNVPSNTLSSLSIRYAMIGGLVGIAVGTWLLFDLFFVKPTT